MFFLVQGCIKIRTDLIFDFLLKTQYIDMIHKKALLIIHL